MKYFCGKKLDKTVKLNLEVVEDIPNDPKTGKYKLIIPSKINHLFWSKVQGPTLYTKCDQTLIIGVQESIF